MFARASFPSRAAPLRNAGKDGRKILMTRRTAFNLTLCASLWLAFGLVVAIFAQDTNALPAAAVAAAASSEHARFLASHEIARGSACRTVCIAVC
jgi:hypothetical protein